MAEEPNQTLYINHINEKVKKVVLKKLLYMIFSQYGRVKQIHACKGVKLRGQAWLVFEDVGAAIKAKSGKDGFIFYDQPLRISFAKTNSRVVDRQKGAGGGKSSKRSRAQKEQSDADGDDGERPSKGAKLAAHADATSSSSSSSVPAATAVVPAAVGNTTVPHKILVAQNLPADCSEATLLALFQSSAGFQEIRMAPGGRGIAFIEFGNEIQAGMAFRQMSGYQLSTTHTLTLTYSN